MIGGINTVNFTFSLVTLYALEKARNGAVVAVLEILKSIDLIGLVVFLAAALIAGGIATFLAMYLTRGFSKYITKINYQMLCVLVISLIVLLVVYFSSWIGLLVLVVSTFIGMLPSFTGVKKSLAMGCLLLPVILFFIL
jgi:putative membrane protein